METPEVRVEARPRETRLSLCYFFFFDRQS